MLVHCFDAIRTRISASGMQHCVSGRLKSGRRLLSSASFVVPQLAVPAAKVQFSVPLHSLETRPDCYRVYKVWCDDVEDDLRTVCTSQLGLGLPETARIVKAAREHHTVISIFLNPARVLARVYSWRPLEQELTGPDISITPLGLAAELFATQPTLISQTSLTLQRKVQHLKQVLEVHRNVDKLSHSIRRRPQLLQRSTTAMSAVFETLSERLGPDTASKTLIRYPELFSRSPDTIANSFSALVDEVGAQVAVRMVVSNPSVLVRKDMAARFVRVSTALDLPSEQAATVIRSLPTLLNIPPATLKRRLRMLSYGLLPWYTTTASLKPSVLGRLLTTPDARLMRLSYIAFLHGFAPPLRMGAYGDLEDEALIEDIAMTRVEPSTASPDVVQPDASFGCTLSGDKQHTSASKSIVTQPKLRNMKKASAAVGVDKSSHQGDRADSALDTVVFLKAPLSFVIMQENEFLSKYPRFPRWLRRKNRSLSVLSVRML